MNNSGSVKILDGNVKVLYGGLATNVMLFMGRDT